MKYIEYLDSFTRLQLDVFHAFWDLYHLSQYRHRPAVTSTSSERLTADRSHALQEVTIGIVVWRDYTDQKGSPCAAELRYVFMYVWSSYIAEYGSTG